MQGIITSLAEQQIEGCVIVNPVDNMLNWYVHECCSKIKGNLRKRFRDLYNTQMQKMNDDAKFSMLVSTGTPFTIGIVHSSHCGWDESADGLMHTGSTTRVMVPKDCMLIFHVFLFHYTGDENIPITDEIGKLIKCNFMFNCFYYGVIRRVVDLVYLFQM